MKRIPPEEEVSLYVTYFWDRLKPSPAPRSQAPAITINLAKQPSYAARRELLGIKSSAELLEWSDKWIDGDDWRKARDTVRAWRYKSRNKLARISLREDTKNLLDERAKAFNLPLWRYLDSLELTPEKLRQLERQTGI